MLSASEADAHVFVAGPAATIAVSHSLSVFEVQVVSHSEAELFYLFVAHDLKFVPAEFQDDLGGEDFSVDGFFFHGLFFEESLHNFCVCSFHDREV
jgi:hypothetical protein